MCPTSGGCVLLVGCSFVACSCSIQVRRTDKINTEAAFHTLAEYMVHVEERYEYQEVLGNHWKKRVYIATDDPSVVKEAINK